LKRSFWLTSLFLLCVLPSAAQTSPLSPGERAPSDDAAWQRYLHIIRTSTLEWTSEPFLLKVDYQLYDLDGRPSIKGTAEESWTEAEGKISIQSPTLVIGDEPSADKYAVFSRESYLVHQAINALSRPFPSVAQHDDFGMDEFRQTPAGSELGCFSLVQPGKTRAPSLPAYCTDPDNHIVAMTGPLFVLERGDFRRYRGHEIPNDLKLSYEGKPALTMHVSELDPLPVPPVSKSKTRPASSRTRVPSETISGLALKQKQPAYPKEAKKRHITGTVIITAIIGKEGTIDYLDVIASPDALLTQAARDAVRTWIYRPYLLNGVLTEVETTINMNFAFVK
jgi:TonB family protein